METGAAGMAVIAGETFRQLDGSGVSGANV